MTGPRPTGRSRLLTGSAWVLVGMAAQALLGFGFWTIGARVADTAEVGRASALFTVAQFLNYLTGMGLTVMLARFAPEPSRDSDRLFGRSVLVGATASVTAAVLFGVFGSASATELIATPGGVALFGFYVGGVSVGLLADVRFMAARRWSWLVGRVVAVGLLRLPLVLWDPGVGADTWLFHLVLAPLAISGWLSFAILRAIGEGRLRFDLPRARTGVVRFAGANWLATLASTAPQYVLPLMVAARVADEDYANFFLAWTITAMVLLVPGAIAQILLLEGSRREGEAAEHVRQAFRFAVPLALTAWAGAFIGGRAVTWVLGEGYRDLARILPALVFAGIPWAVTSVRLSEARLRRDQISTVLVTVALGVVILGSAALWVPRWGLAGATRAWILGNVIGAVVAEACHRGRGLGRISPARSSPGSADDRIRPVRARIRRAR